MKKCRHKFIDVKDKGLFFAYCKIYCQKCGIDADDYQDSILNKREKLIKSLRKTL